MSHSERHSPHIFSLLLCSHERSSQCAGYGTPFCPFLSKSDYGELLTASSSEFRVGFPPERIMFKFRVLQLPLLVLLLASITQGRAQFAHTDGKQIVDAAGKPLLVRAI